VLESGDPSGRPVVYLHGAGSCRLEAECFDATARDVGVRVIAPDRPGRTTRERPVANPTAYAREISALADRLGLDDFAVAGQSNGGMFACAVAHELGERVTKVVPINPTVPVSLSTVRRSLDLPTRIAYATIAKFPGMSARSVVRRGFSGPSGRSAERDPDAHLWRNPLTAPVLQAIGRQPLAVEYVLSELHSGIVHGWGFDHLALKQPVEFFVGDRDGSRGYVEVWARELSDGVRHVFPGGHIGHLQPSVVAAVMGRLAV